MAETKTINLEVETNLGSLKSQLKAAMAEVAAMSEQFGATSEQAAKAAQKAAELKDRIGDAKALTEAFNPEAKFAAMGQAISAASGALTVFQGAMGLAGAESEDLQKTMLKVQSAMAITQGLEALGGLGDAFNNLKSVAVKAFQAIKGAIGSTGIGLLVVALGVVYAYWDDIKAAVNGVSKEQQALNAQAEANVKMQQRKLDTINSQDNILKLQGKTEKEITKIKLKQIDAVIAATKAQLVQQENTKKAEVEATKRNQEYLKLVLRIGLEASASVLRYLALPIDAVIVTANKVAELLGYSKITAFSINDEITKFTKGASESIAGYFFDPEATAAEANKTIRETKNALLKLENDRAGMLLSLDNMDKEAQNNKVQNNKEELSEEEKKLEEEKRLKDEALKAEEQKEAEYQKKLKEIQEQNLANNKSLWDAEIAAVDAKYKELEERAKGNAEEENAIMIAKMNEQNDINLKYQNEQYKINEEARKKEKEAQDKANKEKEEAAKIVNETLAQIREADLNNISAGISLVRDLFQNNKKIQAAALIGENAVGIARTIISTKAANQAARAQGTAAAIVTGGASTLAAEALILRNNISAGISIAAQIAATAKGVAALGGGGAVPSGGGNVSEGGGGGTTVPNFNVVGNSGMNQLAQIQQTPIQAYVVSGEVTSAQALDRNRIKNATL